MDEGLSFEGAEAREALRGTSIFLSASIPDPERWSGEFDALEITDAVVALARSALTAGARLITAAHPTIAPLLLYVAAELPNELEAQVTIYQSAIFEGVLPAATQRFQAEGVATFKWTEAVEGESSDVDNRGRSLELMRRQMLAETEPIAAVFIGGMEGIEDEFALFGELRPGAPTYPIAAPGGEARHLLEQMQAPPVPDLLESRVYPTLWSRVLDDIEAGRLAT
jgi:hypothetical protein